jgi:hypothetical protein
LQFHQLSHGVSPSLRTAAPVGGLAVFYLRLRLAVRVGGTVARLPFRVGHHRLANRLRAALHRLDPLLCAVQVMRHVTHYNRIGARRLQMQRRKIR